MNANPPHPGKDAMTGTPTPAFASKPGRMCPLDYRYRPESIAALSATQTDCLYVIGGLYGNRPALQAVLELAATEVSTPLLCFNGDFNWFNVDAHGFEAINTQVLAHTALRGNVETELRSDAAAGCGCAYPDWVAQDTVERSNQIMHRLRKAAARFPALTRELQELPMTARFRIGGQAVGVVHGDAESLAGWGFAYEALRQRARRQTAAAWFERAQVEVFASSHTCLPTLDRLGPEALLVNNGAAGMPNFSGLRQGLISRLALTTPPRPSIYGTRLGQLHIDAMAVEYDERRWRDEFLTNWAPGTAGHESYFERIENGPAHTREQALENLHAS